MSFGVSEVIEKFTGMGYALRHSAGIPPIIIEDFFTALKPRIPELIELGAINPLWLYNQSEDIRIGYLVHLYGLARWADEGFNIFDLSPALTAGLVLSDPAAYDQTEDTHLPFSSFMVRIPPRLIPMPIRSTNQPGAVNPSGTATQIPQTTGWVRLIAISRFNSNVDGSPELSIHLETDYGGIMLGSTSTLRSLHEAVALLDPNDPLSAVMSSSALLVHNFLVWLNSVDENGKRAIADRRKVPEPHSKHKGRIWPTFWEIGRNIKLHHELMEYARQRAIGDTDNSAFALRHQLKVLGHWQRYWFGSGADKERKWVWKLPYWKGDSEHGIGHRYH